MTMPTLKDLVKIFHAGALDYTHQPTDFQTGLLAVLDAMKPVLAEAYDAGGPTGMVRETREQYATRIIAQLKGDAAK